MMTRDIINYIRNLFFVKGGWNIFPGKNPQMHIPHLLLPRNFHYSPGYIIA